MNPTTHLTPDQIDDHLIGDLAPAAAKHLASCEHCQTLIAAAEAPLAAFRAVSLAWAERRSATLPVPTASAARPSHRLAWASLASAAAAALALAVAVPMLHHAPAATVQPATVATLNQALDAPTSSVSASAKEIASDNAMLAAVDEALNAPIGRPAGFTPGPHHGHVPANLLQQ